MTPYHQPSISLTLLYCDPSCLSRSQIKGLEDKVERSNYDYSKLKKKEREESYSTRCC